MNNLSFVYKFYHLYKYKDIIFHLVFSICSTFTYKRVKFISLIFYYLRTKIHSIGTLWRSNFTYKFKFFSVYSNLSFITQNSYFYFYFLNRDYWVRTFINLLMKNGRKYSGYKMFNNMLWFVKKLIGVNPIYLLKKVLYKNRLLFDIQNLKLRKRTVTMPRLLSHKSQISKSIRYLINDMYLKSFILSTQIDNIHFRYQKLSYLILNNLFNNDLFRLLISKETFIVKNNYYHIKKENYASKYLNDLESGNAIKKDSLYRKKYKSLTKKDKFIKLTKNQFNVCKFILEAKKNRLFDRFKLNLQSKYKLKSKWF